MAKKMQSWEIVGGSIAYLITGIVCGKAPAHLVAVSEAWAWTFHPAWYKEVTGLDPRETYEQALRRTQSRATEVVGLMFPHDL